MEKIKQVLIGHFHLPGTKNADRIVRSMSPTEWLVFVVFSALLFASTVFLLALINFSLIEKVPAPGGRYTEGMVGSPRFINPLLATTGTDESLASIVYAGLMKRTADGRIVPELAENLEVTENETVYTFTIRNDARFHDGTTVTADDVVFTIEKVLDERVKSPQRAAWSGVEATKLSERQVRFVLNEPFDGFLRNTIIGILPKHLWQDVDAEQIPFSNLNINPIGAGPYKVRSFKTKASGVPESYTFERFPAYSSQGGPYIDEISFRFYNSTDELLNAYTEGGIESAREIPNTNIGSMLKRNSTIHTTPLPRVFGIFFNQNNSDVIFEKSVREAVRAAINKEKVVQEALSGYALPANSPFPEHFNTKYGLEKTATNNETVSDILEDAGWTLDEESQGWIFEGNNDIMELTFTLTIPNIEEIRNVSQIIQRDLQESGIKVAVRREDADGLVQSVIRPRNYDALLFGMVVVDPLDLFAFWHSSQRNDPGLNVSLYANLDVDRALRELSRNINEEEVRENLNTIHQEIEEDVPAVFLYIPEFTYLMPERINNVKLGIISKPGDRYANIDEWFIETNRQWTL